MINNVALNTNYNFYNHYPAKATTAVKKDNSRRTINELPNCYCFVLNKKRAVSFGDFPQKTVGQARIFQDGKPLGVDVIARKINDHIIHLSLKKGDDCFGYTDISVQPDHIKILLMDTMPNTKRAGTQLMQSVIELACRYKKQVILDSVRVDEIRDNPAVFYYSRGFVATNPNTHRQILQEIETAKREHRRPNPNTFDKFREIDMRLPEESMQKWKSIISKSPILFIQH